jgi:hypothetical protein
MPFDHTDDPETLRARIDMLMEALGNVLIAADVIRPDVECSGPELIVAAEGFLQNRLMSEARFNAGVVALKHPGHMHVGEPVAREDGRFYVPVSRWPEEEKLSNVVLRVASDAFPDVQSAEVFARIVAHAWNRLPGAILERPA